MDSENFDGTLDQLDQIAGDRRENKRYTLTLEVKYKLIRRKKLVQSGAGRTIDISSGGVLIETDRPLPPGLNMELSISWPVLLNDVAPMRLFVTGRIVRSVRNRAAVRTGQYEFRTQGATSARVDSSDGLRPSGGSGFGSMFFSPMGAR
jgi:hypothetical protein